jgi:UDP:flavonoid glycosyltransferase YjiC (YdhE family)
VKILFVTAPFKSHLYVQVPLAMALRTAGHEVRMAGPPELADDIATAGLMGVSIGGPAPSSRMAGAEPVAPVRQALRTGHGPKSRQAEYGVADPVADLESNVRGWRELFNPDSAFTDAIEFAQLWKPDLVVSDTFTFTGSVAARVVGAAHVRMLFGADGLGQLYSQLRRVWRDQRAEERIDPMRDWLAPILQRYGQSFDDGVVLGERTVFPVPDWFSRADGIDYIPMRHLAFNGPIQAARWMYDKPARRRVCVSLGLSHREGNFGVVPATSALFSAVDGLDIEVVATLNDQQMQGVSTVPDNVRVIDFAPLNVLLPSCSAMVHSGGSGTFAGALEHAVPQLIIPTVYWSEKWWGPVAMANGVEDQKIGRYVCDADELTGEILREALVGVLGDDAYTDNAERVRVEVSRLPSPNQVADQLHHHVTTAKR